MADKQLTRGDHVQGPRDATKRSRSLNVATHIFFQGQVYFEVYSLSKSVYRV